MAGSDAPYWFPAKRRGWGWGVPAVWQGWAVLAAFGLLVLAGAAHFLPAQRALAFVLWCVGLCGLLMLVCWWKGEPPGARKI